MKSEVEVYANQLGWVLQRAAELVERLDQAQLHWQPDLPSTNSAAAIATDMAGATAAYALEMGAGIAVGRDRTAEFAPAGIEPASAANRLHGLASDIAMHFARLSPDDLVRITTPSQETWGTGEPHPILAREAIVEAIRHAGIHLGELRLIYDLARAATRD